MGRTAVGTEDGARSVRPVETEDGAGNVRAVETEDGSLSVRVAGDEGGPALVLLHGIPGSSSTWDAVVPRLAGDFRVVVPDLLGFGESARPEPVPWADRQAAAVERALDELRIERALVAGHDWGGPVAVHLHARAAGRVAGLVLATTNLLHDTPIPMPIVAVTWPVVGRPLGRLLFSGPSLRMMLRRGVATPGVAVDPGPALGDAAQRRAVRTIFTSALRELDRLYRPVSEAARGVDVPTVVVWAGHDPFFSVADGRRTAGLIPGADFRLLEDCGHYVPAERPDELVAAIRDVAERSAVAAG